MIYGNIFIICIAILINLLITYNILPEQIEFVAFKSGYLMSQVISTHADGSLLFLFTSRCFGTAHTF